jgi:D-psicose/D-tagatose/L-ribulose 3-epimerase
MKFGINTWVWTASFEPANYSLLAGIREAGFDGLEVPIFDPATFAASAIRRESDKYGLRVNTVGIVPNGASLASPDPAERRKGRDHLKGCIRAAAEAGAQVHAGPVYSPVGFFTGNRRTPDEWSAAVDSWRELAPVAEECGVDIGIEPLNRFETYFLNTVADGVAFCAEIGHPRVGLLVDTFHCNIEEKSIGVAIRHAAPWIRHLHASENDRGIPGSGNVNWPEYVDAVAEIGYDRWMTIESFGSAIGEMSSAASIWRDLAPTPDSIAFDGLRFLKAETEKTRKQHVIERLSAGSLTVV